MRFRRSKYRLAYEHLKTCDARPDAHDAIGAGRKMRGDCREFLRHDRPIVGKDFSSAKSRLDRIGVIAEYTVRQRAPLINFVSNGTKRSVMNRFADALGLQSLERNVAGRCCWEAHRRCDSISLFFNIPHPAEDAHDEHVRLGQGLHQTADLFERRQTAVPCCLANSPAAINSPKTVRRLPRRSHEDEYAITMVCSPCGT